MFDVPYRYEKNASFKQNDFRTMDEIKFSAHYLILA